VGYLIISVAVGVLYRTFYRGDRMTLAFTSATTPTNYFVNSNLVAWPVATNLDNWPIMDSDSSSTSITTRQTINIRSANGTKTLYLEDGQSYTVTTYTTGNVTSLYLVGETTSTSTAFVNTTSDGVIVWHSEANNAQQRRNAIRQYIRSNINEGISKSLSPKAQANELKARLALRDLISEKEWRVFMARGFVMARGASGNLYRIFADGRQVEVYVNHQLKDRVCIHTSAECPPTDHVLNMKILIEMDEEAFLKSGNLRGVHMSGLTFSNKPFKSLLEVTREYPPLRA